MGNIINDSTALTSYRLCQFLSDYIRENRPDIRSACGSLEDVEGVIHSTSEQPSGRRTAITSRTARKWLQNRLGYSWKDIKKGVFFDGHERDDVVQYRKEFLEVIKNLLLYMAEFNADGSMKAKMYPSDCTVGGPDRRPVIFITHDESIFSANDGRHQAWISKYGTFKRPKGKGKGIMVSDFLLPWSRLNLLSLHKEQQERLVAASIPLEAVEYFEYGQEEGHWDGEKLLDQVTKQAIPIAEALYPGYQLLFLFDNATSYSVYAGDALTVKAMNKGEGGAQPILRNGWYHDGHDTVVQEMFYTKVNPSGIVTRVVSD